MPRMGNMEMDSTLVVPGAGRGWGHSGVAKQGEVKNPNLLRQPLSTSSALQGNRAKKRPDGRCAGSFPPRCPQAGRWAKDSCSHSTPRLGLTSVTLYFIFPNSLQLRGCSSPLILSPLILSTALRVGGAGFLFSCLLMREQRPRESFNLPTSMRPG